MTTQVALAPPHPQDASERPPSPAWLRAGGQAPPPRTLVDVLSATAAAHPDEPALDDGRTVLTYRELQVEATRLAAGLAAAGVRRGDRVGLRVSSGRADLHVGILGILSAGAAYVPVDADDPDERATLVFAEGGARVALTDAGIVPTGDEPDRRGPVRSEPRPAAPGLDDDAWVIFTSGSTGTPKGVAVTHRSAAAFVDAEARLFLTDEPLGPGDRVLAGLSVAFDASCEEMWLAWRHGACLVPAPRSLVRSGVDLGPWLVRQGITVVSTVPTLAALWPPDCLAGVRLLIFGGEGLPADLVSRVVGDGRQVWNTYGPTEATVVACAAQMQADEPVRIGVPLPGWDLAVVDGDGAPVGPGETGELVIGGVGLARYLDAARDARAFAPAPALGWDRAYRSGDLVRLDPQGVVFVGRADDQVKIGGRRIELGEIDAALCALPGVAGAAAAVRPSAGGVDVLVGYVMPRPDPDAAGAFDIDAARERLAESLPAALVPRLAVVADLPTRTSGKVDRDALPWPLAGPEPTAGVHLSGTTAWVAGLWESILGCGVRGPDDDFFVLGGGSLPAARLVSLLRERHPRVTVGDVYDYPRLGALAQELDERAAREASDALGEPDGAPPAPAVPRPVPLVTQAVQLVVLVALAGVVAARWLVAFLAGAWLLAHVPGFAALPSAPPALLAAGLLLLWTPPGQLGLAAAACRIALRGAQPGDHPRGGSVHLRVWACERLVDALGAGGLAGAPWVPYYARALGARIGPGVDLHAVPPVTGFLTLGRGACVEPEVDLSGHWVDGDIFRLGRLRVGADACVGSRSVLLPGARVGRGARVEPGSAVHGRVPAGQVWSGSPAAPVAGRRGAGDWPEERPPRARGWVLVYALSAAVLAAVPAVATLPGMLVLLSALRGRTGAGDAVVPVLLSVPLATLVGLGSLALAVAGVVRLLGLGLSEGVHPVRSRVGWQVWATHRVLDVARTLLFPLYASQLTPAWLRVLGARVGRDVEASTVLLVPSMTQVGDGAFLADDTLVGAYELRHGWMRVGRTRIGKRAFLGNSGMAAPGRKVPKDGLVAVLSAAPPRGKAGTSWLGSPPVRLRHRPPAAADEARTFAPTSRLKVARGVVEAFRVVPVMTSVALGVLVVAALWWLLGVGPVALAIGAPLVLVAAAVCAAAVTAAAKWALVGRIRAGEHPLWSGFVWRAELADTFTEVVAAPWFAAPATGTPALVAWLRLLGARIGRGVWCESYWLPEVDLVRLEAGSVVGRGCVAQTHLFHDRVMSLDAVRLGPGATLGPQGVVLPGAALGAGVTVGPASLVLRGEALPDGTRWVGNPVAPWDAP